MFKLSRSMSQPSKTTESTDTPIHDWTSSSYCASRQHRGFPVLNSDVIYLVMEHAYYNEMLLPDFKQLVRYLLSFSISTSKTHWERQICFGCTCMAKTGPVITIPRSDFTRRRSVQVVIIPLRGQVRACAVARQLRSSAQLLDHGDRESLAGCMGTQTPGGDELVPHAV